MWIDAQCHWSSGKGKFNLNEMLIPQSGWVWVALGGPEASLGRKVTQPPSLGNLCWAFHVLSLLVQETYFLAWPWSADPPRLCQARDWTFLSGILRCFCSSVLFVVLVLLELLPYLPGPLVTLWWGQRGQLCVLPVWLPSHAALGLCLCHAGIFQWVP